MDHTVLAIVGIEQFSDLDFVLKKVETYLARTGTTAQLIISGDTPGPNQMAKDISIAKGIAYQLFRTDWDSDGKAAIYRRDERIIEAATHLVVIHDDRDRCVTELLNKALAARKNVLRVIVAPTAGTYRTLN